MADFYSENAALIDSSSNIILSPTAGGTPRKKILIQNQAKDGVTNIRISWTDNSSPTNGMLLPPMGYYYETGEDVHQGQATCSSVDPTKTIDVYIAVA